MSTRAARYVNRRKDRVDLDLNSAPPGDNRDQEGTSTPADPQNNQATLQGQSAPPNMIDVEAIDDDVVESSPRAFAEVCLILSLQIPFVVVISIHLVCICVYLNISLIF